MGLIKMYARPITYKVNGPGTEETAEGFVATPVRYSTISVEDLADHISADSRVERSKVAVITDSLIKQIREMVLNGHKIVVPHLGSFKPKIKSQLAINPESVDATSFSAKVRFTPSVELKRDLQAARIEKTTLPVAPAAPSIEVQKASALNNFESEVKAWLAANKPNYTISDPPAFADDFDVQIGDENPSVVTIACGISGGQGTPDWTLIGWCIAKNSATNSYDGFNKTGAFVNNSLSAMTLGQLGADLVALKRVKFTAPFTVE